DREEDRPQPGAQGLPGRQVARQPAEVAESLGGEEEEGGQGRQQETRPEEGEEVAAGPDEEGGGRPGPGPEQEERPPGLKRRQRPQGHREERENVPVPLE